MKQFIIEERDPAQPRIEYKVTLVFKDGRMVEVPESYTVDQRIMIRSDMRGHQVVTVHPERLDFAQKNLTEITVELQYADGGVSFADRFSFRTAQAQAAFEFDYVDEAKRDYQYKTSWSYANGLSRGTDWTTTNVEDWRSRSPRSPRGRRSMLQLGSKTQTIEGVTVFADHADPDQFWYLPAPGRAGAPAPRTSGAQFTLIKYRPAAVAGGAKGGGFLMMRGQLQLDAATRAQDPRQGRGAGTGHAAARPGAVRRGHGAVRRAQPAGRRRHRRRPRRPGRVHRGRDDPRRHQAVAGGDNNAVFSLTLSQEGATILDQAFEQGATPVGVIYDLKYTALGRRST